MKYFQKMLIDAIGFESQIYSMKSWEKQNLGAHTYSNEITTWSKHSVMKSTIFLCQNVEELKLINLSSSEMSNKSWNDKLINFTRGQIKIESNQRILLSQGGQRSSTWGWIATGMSTVGNLTLGAIRKSNPLNVVPLKKSPPAARNLPQVRHLRHQQPVLGLRQRGLRRLKRTDWKEQLLTQKHV